TRNFAELQSRGAHASGSAVDKESLALVQLRDAMQHLVGGNVVENETDGCSGIKVVRDRNEMRGGNNRVSAVAANHGERRNPLANRETADTVAERVNFAHDVVARREGKGRGTGVQAVAHQDVGESHACSNDFDAHLARRGSRQVIFDPFENLRPAEAGNHHASVLDGGHDLLSHRRRNVRKRKTVRLRAGQCGRLPHLYHKGSGKAQDWMCASRNQRSLSSSRVSWVKRSAVMASPRSADSWTAVRMALAWWATLWTRNLSMEGPSEAERSASFRVDLAAVSR